MVELIFLIIFVFVVFILALLSKKILYVNEHFQSIKNELKTFDDNYKAIEYIDKIPDFKLGSGHLYK